MGGGPHPHASGKKIGNEMHALLVFMISQALINKFKNLYIDGSAASAR